MGDYGHSSSTSSSPSSTSSSSFASTQEEALLSSTDPYCTSALDIISSFDHHQHQLATINNAFAPSLLSSFSYELIDPGIITMTSSNLPPDSLAFLMSHLHAGAASPGRFSIDLLNACYGGELIASSSASSAIDGIIIDRTTAHVPPADGSISSTHRFPNYQINPAADPTPPYEELLLAHSSLPWAISNATMDAEQVDEGSNSSSNSSSSDQNQVIRIILKWDDARPIDDYEWRKYGQKHIKDKTHPRNYFRCAKAGCPIKKYTERLSEMEGCVLVTYIGRHNHHP